MGFIIGLGILALVASLVCFVVGLIMLIIYSAGDNPQLKKTGLRVLLASGICFLLSITFCSAGSFNL